MAHLTAPFATRVLNGALAGIVATAAMSVSMAAMFKRLPYRERYPLPPRELTQAIVRPPADIGESARLAATMVSHFGYGAATGALYGALRTQPAASLTQGAAYGVLVWTASYLGWIPAARLLRPATEHPARRNALMITAHVVWGATLALTLDQLNRAGRPLRDGPLLDR